MLDAPTCVSGFAIDQFSIEECHCFELIACYRIIRCTVLVHNFYTIQFTQMRSIDIKLSRRFRFVGSGLWNGVFDLPLCSRISNDAKVPCLPRTSIQSNLPRFLPSMLNGSTACDCPVQGCKECHRFACLFSNDANVPSIT